MLILDIPCQQFGDKCKLEGFFVPFGHRDGKCIFIDIYIYIGYMLPTLASISHIRSHQSQYINHINQSYQKPPVSIHKSHQSVISETTSLNTSIRHIRGHQCQYINDINQTHQKPPMSIHQSHHSDTSETTSLNTSIVSIGRQ